MRAFFAAGYPARPYPGARPDFSFVQSNGTGHRLRFDNGRWLIEPDAVEPDGVGPQAVGLDGVGPQAVGLDGVGPQAVEPNGVGPQAVEPDGVGPQAVGLDGVGPEAVKLDDWLAAHDAPALGDRFPLLAYGSNACPAKIAWLGDQLGLPGPVVVLRATYVGVVAVWAAGFRVVDQQRPATLAAAPGVRETHAVWLATPPQLAILDVCEGRGVRYDLARLRTGTVTLESGTALDRPLAYVGHAPSRLPLLVDGRPVRCESVPQHHAAALTGVPAGSDGLDREVVTTSTP